MIDFQVDDLLIARDFYTRTAQYMRDVDSVWDEDRIQQAMATERTRLATVLGRGRDQAVLDCSCGPGTQAIPLAELGWRVTGIDANAAVMPGARARAERAGAVVGWRVRGMRE